MYCKQIEIDFSYYNNTNGFISILGFISIEQEQIRFNVCKYYNDSWTLTVFNEEKKIWSKSCLFPERLSIDAWENKELIVWITENIRSIVYLSGKNLILQ